MSGEKAEAMSNGSEESCESKTTKVNKYACACVLTASIISAIFGYGERFIVVSIYVIICY